MKRPVLIMFIFLLVAGIGAGLLYLSSITTKKETKKQTLELPHGKQTYLIQSASAETAPSIYEATVDPVDVKPGDMQKMEVKVRSENEIVEVKAEVETDNGIKTYPLNLASGTAKDGVWQGEWKVVDTHDEIYHTKFTAKDGEEKTSSVTITWTDPCTPPISGTWTLAGACNTGAETTGAAAGGIVLGNYDLTIEQGGKVVWAEGSSTIINGTGKIIKNTGSPKGILKQEKIWMLDADGDGYPATTTQVGGASPGTGYRERQLLSGYTAPSVDQNDGSTACAPTCGPTTVTAYFDKDVDGYYNTIQETLEVNLNHQVSAGNDCYDNNNNAYPAQTNYFSTTRGDGSFDYNCDGTAEKAPGISSMTSLSTFASNGCFSSQPAGHGGWVSAVAPDCGDSSQYYYECSVDNGGSCTGGYFTSTGQCASEAEVTQGGFSTIGLRWVITARGWTVTCH